MSIFCIGDTHGKFPQLAQVLRSLPQGARVICVGDIGLGFEDSKSPSCLDEVDEAAREMNQCVWLMRGNHDDPSIWQENRHKWNEYLTNVRIPTDVHRMLVENTHIIMVGGAISMDRGHAGRIDGVNWWADEAVAPSALETVREMVAEFGRADLLVTHAGPFEALPNMRRDIASFDHYSVNDPALRADVLAERQLLSRIVTASQTRTCVYGHYHESLENEIGRQRYRCCAELEPWQYIKRAALPPLLASPTTPTLPPMPSPALPPLPTVS